MRDKFTYSCSIKVHALGFQKLGRHFMPLAGCGRFSLQKVVEMLEEVTVSWREVS